jgi:hypothetical protein
MVTDKPSIAVLPFVNMSGDPEQQYFRVGITEDILTELSRFRALSVIAQCIGGMTCRDWALCDPAVFRQWGDQMHQSLDVLVPWMWHIGPLTYLVSTRTGSA